MVEGGGPAPGEQYFRANTAETKPDETIEPDRIPDLNIFPLLLAAGLEPDAAEELLRNSNLIIDASLAEDD